MQPLWPPLPLRGFVDACGGLVAARPVHRRGSWNVVRVTVDGDPCGPMFPQVIRAGGECLNLAFNKPAAVWTTDTQARSSGQPGDSGGFRSVVGSLGRGERDRHGQWNPTRANSAPKGNEHDVLPHDDGRGRFGS